MKLIRGKIDAPLLGLQVVDLLRPGVNVKDMIVNKFAIYREKAKTKVKSDEKHKEDLRNP